MAEIVHSFGYKMRIKQYTASRLKFVFFSWLLSILVITYSVLYIEKADLRFSVSANLSGT